MSSDILTVMLLFCDVMPCH